jgi:uncharacterized protein (TIGR02266 family)
VSGRDRDDDEQRRKDLRVTAAFKVRYSTLDQLVVAYTHDLSHGGMFLRTRQLVPVGTFVRVHIDLPDDGGELAVIARVTHVRSLEEAEAMGKPAGMGVEFLDLAPDGLAQIELFIASRTQGSEGTGPIRLKRRLNILVVDDDEQFRQRAADTFSARGDTVRTAVDGLEGLGMCLQSRPDAVVTDVNMPRLDGWQLLRMIRARPSMAMTPVIFLTALGTDEDRLRGYQLGVDDFVPKPYQPDELAARVDRVMARSLGSERAVPLERRSLHGDLDQVALASVLSFLEVERKTGILQVLRDRSVRFYIRDGRPMRVEEEGQANSLSREAIYDILSWPDGEFEFSGQPVEIADELETTSTALILESARRSDERSR